MNLIDLSHRVRRTIPVGDAIDQFGLDPLTRRSGAKSPRLVASGNGRGDRTRTGGIGAHNLPLTRCDSHDAAISATSWGLSGAEIPACEPVAPPSRSLLLPIGRAGAGRRVPKVTIAIPRCLPGGPCADLGVFWGDDPVDRLRFDAGRRMTADGKCAAPERSKRGVPDGSGPLESLTQSPTAAAPHHSAASRPARRTPGRGEW